MSLARQLSQGIQKKKVSIDEVRENPSNFYEVKDSDVEKVMRSMLTEGQLENAVAYEDESPDDGKKYTLIVEPQILPVFKPQIISAFF